MKEGGGRGHHYIKYMLKYQYIEKNPQVTAETIAYLLLPSFPIPSPSTLSPLALSPSLPLLLVFSHFTLPSYSPPSLSPLH